MDIFESKLIFNHIYGSAEKNFDLNKIDEIDNNYKENNKDNNIKNVDNNITSNNNEKTIDNKNNGYIFKEIVNKGIYDYINKIRFCNSSKNLTSVENISEEIDLDDINDDDLDDNNENNNNKGHKQFTLTTFDELDEEDEGNNNNDSIG